MDFQKIQKYWMQYWEENETFKTDMYDFSKPKFYALDMFPYPSGVGLHAGHPEGYTATDIVSRMKRMQGFNVLHPMGFDSFGLPAEQYAIKTGNHPEKFTLSNIETFKTQLKMLGFSFDWSKEISTSDKDYYKWTQWIFKLLYNDGLAKIVDMPVNWCAELGTVLANDEVIDGKSERGGYPVIRKNMKQWVIDIPAYAETLLKGLDDINWPESTKEIQKNWIGKSIGAEVIFKIANSNLNFTVFTTRCDTLFGATYCVLAPEHELVKKITSTNKIKEVNDYIKFCSLKSEIERTELNKEKTGVFIGAYAINPVNKKEIPIWISDYVLSSYGTGAIMAVPAHDERDYEFAKEKKIDIIPVIEEEIGTIRDNEINKKMFALLLYNPKEDKYLTMECKKTGKTTLIDGVIESNETLEECAYKTILEKTGYVNFKEQDTCFNIFNHYYDSIKNIAICADVTGMLFVLEDEEKTVVKDAHEELDELLSWKTKEEINNLIIDPLYKTIFNNLLEKGPYLNDGKHVNSEFLNGLNKEESIKKTILWLEKNKCGVKKINYRLREWIFARQRYWGEPIPIIYDENGNTSALDDKDLPLILPPLDDYSPGKDGVSPLDLKKDWVNIEYHGKKVKRETSTMPGSAGSSWYFLRYLDPHNNNEIASKKLIEHWMPVDLYVGGPEHAVGHLLYARMWNNYLYDKNIVSVKEPFKKLVHQGMILGSNGIKMGKRFPKYSINPTDIVNKYGADTLRLYEMFMGPLEADKPWSNEGVVGAKKFLDRVWRLYTVENKNDGVNQNLEKIYNQTVKKVTNDYETLNFNTAISQLMIFINAVYKEDIFPKEYKEGFIKLLNPIAPFITEEIWANVLEHNNTIAYEKWPTYDDNKIIDDKIKIGIQVNSKLRAVIEVNINETEENIIDKFMKEENVLKYLENKTIIKQIIVKNKIVNILVK